MNLYVITGPTASGKTAMSIELAERIGGEIINADSMQIYKYMDIGTAKPTVGERRAVPHHLIDIVHPSESYSVADYCDEARRCIDGIVQRGKIPILVGGTGLYIDSVVYNINYSPVRADESYRSMMNEEADRLGNEYIYNKLRKIDPQSAEKIEMNDRRRIIRALEVYRLTGETQTEHKIRSRQTPPPHSAKIYAINTDRQILYDRINKRVDIMFERGLADEVKALVEMGIDRETTAMQAIGYKEVLHYLDGDISLEEAKEIIKQSSRRYAKRQLTWFRRNDDIEWVESVKDCESSPQ